MVNFRRKVWTVSAAAAMLLPLVFLTAMVVQPLWAMVEQNRGVWMWSVLDDGYMRRLMAWTVFQAAFSGVLSLLVGLPVAWVLARFDFFGRRVLLRLLMLPFVMPTLVAGMGVLALFGDQGLLWRGWADTPYLLLYGNLFFNLPVLVRAAYQGLCRVPATRLYAAQTLGASAWRRFWLVEWPVLLPWLAGGVCLVFLYCFSGFGLALLLGGERFATIEVEIYRLIAFELDMSQSAVLVVAALAVTFAAGAAYAVCSRWARSDSAVRFLPPVRPYGRQRWAVAAALAVLVLCCVLPLAAVVWRAAHAGASWQVLAEASTWQAVGNTLRFTAAAMCLALPLGVAHAALARRLAWVRSITFLPFMVSPVCVSFGLLLCYPDWTASLSMLVCTYALLAYPFVTKDVLAAWDGLPETPQYAARTLGAAPYQVWWRVTLPLLRPAVQRSLALAAATCVGEFAATLFLSRPEWQTVTTLIYQYLGTAGRDNADRAMVLTLVLMLVSVLLFAVLEWSARPLKGNKNADLA